MMELLQGFIRLLLYQLVPLQSLSSFLLWIWVMTSTTVLYFWTIIASSSRLPSQRPSTFSQIRPACLSLVTAAPQPGLRLAIGAASARELHLSSFLVRSYK